MVAQKCWEERQPLPLVLLVDLPFKGGDNRLPTATERDQLNNMEAKVIKNLTEAHAVYVGHITSTTGVMKAVFRSAAKAPQRISVKTGVLSKLEVPVVCIEDPDWKWHEEHMVPTPAEQYETQFRGLYAQLAAAGDDNSKARNVEFAAKFKSSDDREQFLKAVAEEGFSTHSSHRWEPEGEFWCTFHQNTNIEWGPMSQKHARLQDLAERFKGSFDGWETPVAK